MGYLVLNIRWKFRGLANIVMTKEKELWQLPYTTTDLKNIGYRRIKEKIHQGALKYNIHGRWISKRKLNELAYYADEIITTNIVTDKPFCDEK